MHVVITNTKCFVLMMLMMEYTRTYFEYKHTQRDDTSDGRHARYGAIICIVSCASNTNASLCTEAVALDSGGKDILNTNTHREMTCSMWCCDLQNIMCIEYDMRHCVQKLSLGGGGTGYNLMTINKFQLKQNFIVVD